MHPIGKNIKILRQMQGVTQTRLAEAVGVAPAYISMYLSMIRVPCVMFTHRFALALGTTVGTLLGETPEANNEGLLSTLLLVQMLKRLVLELEAELERETTGVLPESAADSEDPRDALRPSA
jgi:transcriptional regulator with XRE-family HTH domain